MIVLFSYIIHWMEDEVNSNQIEHISYSWASPFRYMFAAGAPCHGGLNKYRKKGSEYLVSSARRLLARMYGSWTRF